MGQVALITGARRVGLEIAKELLKEGWQLTVVYHTSQEVVRELKKYGEVEGIKADLSDFSSYQRVVNQAVEKFGRLDAFLHLASPYYPTPLDRLNLEDLMNHFMPIGSAFLFLTKECARHMERNSTYPKGRIIAFGDWATNTTPYKNYSAYFLAKGALHTAVKVLAKELSPHILVNGIALGPTIKPPDFSQEKWDAYIQKTPLKREVSLKDVVELTKYLLRVETMTGEIINLDSGRHIAGECT